MDFATKQQAPFRRRDLLRSIDTSKVSEASVMVLLNRLVSSGRMVHTGYGLYALPKEQKAAFMYIPYKSDKDLAGKIKVKFPFVDFCVWRPAALTQFMQHVPAVGIILVDVERAAMESVFHFLQGLEMEMPVLLHPSTQECERYITKDDIVIIRPLVKESPVIDVDGYTVPRLEKMLVDAIADKELLFFQGAELYTIFENAFERNIVSTSRLLRYASRRNRKEKVKQILKTIGI